MPVAVPIQWAGNIPMAIMTGVAVLGIHGAFTARVMFYADRYTGRWQNPLAAESSTVTPGL